MTPQQISNTLIEASRAFDSAMRRLNPLVLPELRDELLVHLEPLGMLRKGLQADDPALSEERIKTGLMRACDFLSAAIRNFANAEDLQAAYIAALRAARKHCRALEALFTLCGDFPGIDRYFGSAPALPDYHRELDFQHAPTGLFHVGRNQDLHARGGYSLFIPEAGSFAPPLPLIVALHGGYSHGRDFIWTWLAHARNRGYAVFAPTSAAMSWSIGDAAQDALRILEHLEDVFTRVDIDRSRILLSGMSDGGTYALDLALSQGGIFRNVACAACALAPFDPAQAPGKHIFWIHGAQDWIFPVSNAVEYGRKLKSAGADIRMKVLPDLSHAYPVEENGAILDWFEKISG